MDDKLTILHDKIYQDDSTKEPRRFIQLIENDLSVIDSREYENQSDKIKATRLQADYGIMLVKAGYFKKAIIYLEKAIRKFESDKMIADLWSEPMYEALIFNRGIVNHRLQNRKKAKDDFKTLTKKYPDNDLYQSWLKSGADYNYGKVEWIFAGIAMVSIFFSFLLDKEDGVFDRLALYGIFIGLFGGIIVNQIRKRRMKIK